LKDFDDSMNKYRLLGLLVLVICLLLLVLTFYSQTDGESFLILRYEVKVKYSLLKFRLFIVAYSVILSGLAFWSGYKTTLAVKSFWMHISLLILPLTIFTVITMLPKWTIWSFFDGGHEPGFYYDYINNFGLFNICLIILNVLGLFIFGLQVIIKSKET
jgi:hypothetical protein